MSENSDTQVGGAAQSDEEKTRCVVIQKPRYVEATEFTPFDDGEWRSGLRVVERDYGGVFVERLDRYGDTIEHGYRTKERVTVHDRHSDLLGHTLVDFEGQWRINGEYVEEWSLDQADGPEKEGEAHA